MRVLGSLTFANPDGSGHRLRGAGRCAFLPGSSVRERSYLGGSLLLLVTRGTQVSPCTVSRLKDNTNPSCPGDIFLSYHAQVLYKAQSPETRS